MNAFLKNRWAISLVTLCLILGVGLAIHQWPEADLAHPAAIRPPVRLPADAVLLPIGQEAAIRQRFDQGVAMLHTKQYEYALTAFHWVLQQAPNLPEAHVNMGFTLLGLAQPKAAQDFFQAAIGLRPYQVNAFYGLAVAMAALDDLAGARGAMRTFIHLAPPTDPALAKAQALLEQWAVPPPLSEATIR